MAQDLYLPISAVSEINWPSFPPPGDIACQALLYQLSRSQWWSQSSLQQHQLVQACNLLQHALKTVPYYEDALVDIDDEIWQKPTLQGWSSLPLLTREDIQASPEKLMTSALPSGHGRTFDLQTSGSTGRPIQVKGSRLTGLFYRTLGLRFHFWHKRDFRSKDLTVRSTRNVDMPPSGVRTMASWVSGYKTGKSVLMDISLPTDVIYRQVLHEEPDYIQTHPSVVKALIDHSTESNRFPEHLKEIRTFGEVLDPELRMLCREYWKVPIADNYSATEVGVIALQCPEQEHYHVQSESVFVEVVDAQGLPCRPGEIGRIVVTVLHNFATPLIRYELGDYAEVGEKCSCGRGLPVLHRILGRVRNLVRLPDGRTLHPEFSSEKLNAIAPIRQYQLTQVSLEQIEVKLVMPRELTDVERTALCNYFSRNFRYDFRYRFLRVENIPKTEAGKYEVFRSDIVDQ